MTIQTLLHTMEEEGRRELADVLAEDERRAQEILRSARLRVERDRAEHLGRVEAAAREEALRLRSAGGAASRARVREVVDAELERVRATAEQELRDLAGTDRGASATLDLLDEALALLPSAGSCTVDPAHAEVVRRHRPELSVTTGPVGVGVRVHDAQGRTVHNTALDRLDSAWPLLRPVLLAAVSAPPPEGDRR